MTGQRGEPQFGRWGYVEIDTMLNAEARLDDAITALYADDPIIGEPIATGAP